MNKERLVFLDNLRGVSILLVLFFHIYSRWPAVTPYPEFWINFPIFKVGYLGVSLFFLISAFVILMTLENCQNFIIFVKRRLLIYWQLTWRLQQESV